MEVIVVCFVGIFSSEMQLSSFGIAFIEHKTDSRSYNKPSFSIRTFGAICGHISPFSLSSIRELAVWFFVVKFDNFEQCK